MFPFTLSSSFLRHCWQILLLIHNRDGIYGLVRSGVGLHFRSHHYTQGQGIPNVSLNPYSFSNLGVFTSCSVQHSDFQICRVNSYRWKKCWIRQSGKYINKNISPRKLVPYLSDFIIIQVDFLRTVYRLKLQCAAN